MRNCIEWEVTLLKTATCPWLPTNTGFHLQLSSTAWSAPTKVQPHQTTHTTNTPGCLSVFLLTFLQSHETLAPSHCPIQSHQSLLCLRWHRTWKRTGRRMSTILYLADSLISCNHLKSFFLHPQYVVHIRCSINWDTYNVFHTVPESMSATHCRNIKHHLSKYRTNPQGYRSSQWARPNSNPHLLISWIPLHLSSEKIKLNSKVKKYQSVSSL